MLNHAERHLSQPTIAQTHTYAAAAAAAHSRAYQNNQITRRTRPPEHVTSGSLTRHIHTTTPCTACANPSIMSHLFMILQKHCHIIHNSNNNNNNVVVVGYIMIIHSLHLRSV